MESLSLVCLVLPEGRRRRSETPPPTTSDRRVLREPALATPNSSDAEQAGGRKIQLRFHYFIFLVLVQLGLNFFQNHHLPLDVYAYHHYPSVILYPQLVGTPLCGALNAALSKGQQALQRLRVPLQRLGLRPRRATRPHCSLPKQLMRCGLALVTNIIIKINQNRLISRV